MPPESGLHDEGVVGRQGAFTANAPGSDPCRRPPSLLRQLSAEVADRTLSPKEGDGGLEHVAHGAPGHGIGERQLEHLSTSVEVDPSRGVPGSPPPAADPARPRGASPDSVGLTDSQQVRDLQRALKDRGMHPGPVNGIVSPETRAAIRAFQEAQKVPVTGRLDSQTREKLGMSP